MRLFGNEKSHYKMYKAGKLWVAALIGLVFFAGGSQVQSVTAKTTSPTNLAATKAAGTIATRQSTALAQQATALGQSFGLTNQKLTADASSTATVPRANRLRTTLATASAPVVTTSKLAAATPDINTWMPDKNLQAIVLDALQADYPNLTNASQITQQMMTKLTSLYPDQTGSDLVMWHHVLNLQSLDGLQYATNLTELDLSPDQHVNYAQTGNPLKTTQLSDISAIANLTKLDNVNFQMCNLHDISAFKNLTKITQLSLSYNHITDVSPLAKLPIYQETEMGFQSYAMPTIHLNTNTDSLTLPSIVIRNLTGANIPVIPYDSQTQGDYNKIFENAQIYASRYISNATGSVLDSKGHVIQTAGPTIKWDNLKNEGYLTYYWTDPFKGSSAYPYFGFVVIPYEKDASVGTVTINYVNDAGTNLATTVLSGKLGSDYDVLTNQNVTNELATLKSRYGYTSDEIVAGVQKGQYSVKGATVTIKLSNSKQVTETKTVKQTINYVYEDGKTAHAPATNELKFTRTNTVDDTGKVLSYGKWTPASSSFKAVTSPTITGYTPDKTSSDAVNDVTADSKDNVQTITYKKNPVVKGTVNVKYIDDKGKDLGQTAMSGDVGTNYDVLADADVKAEIATLKQQG
ncbi:hypothetical protein Lpp126_06335, partial [Lacticaseibacillus paracasei subsp. paracasei Lpp126]